MTFSYPEDRLAATVEIDGDEKRHPCVFTGTAIADHAERDAQGSVRTTYRGHGRLTLVGEAGSEAPPNDLQGLGGSTEVTTPPPIQISDEMIAAYEEGFNAHDCGPGDCCVRSALKAVAALIAAQVLRQRAELIRAELVCCDVYERLGPVLQAKNLAGEWTEVDDENTAGHQICYWGEAAAMLVDPEAADG